MTKRLLLINPNTSVSMTDTLSRVARTAVSDGVEIVPVTASKGVPYISSRAEAQIAGAVVLELIAEQGQDADAVVIAAFGDPGLLAAREQFNLPVVGMAQASIATASLLGERFAIVTFTPLMSRWYIDSVESSGHADRFSGVRTPAMDALDAFAEQDAMQEELLKLVKQCVEEDGADVVILGGAPLAGMAARMQPQVTALLLDPVSCAVALAETLTKLSEKEAFRRRHGRPAAKSSTGLAAALATVLGESAG